MNLTHHPTLPQKALSTPGGDPLVTWRECIKQARREAKTGQWREAIYHYAQALDAAERIFSEAPVSLAVKRYIRTASELAYCIRQSGYKHSTDKLTSLVKKTLDHALYPASTRLLMRPLITIAQAPHSEVHLQMHKLFD